MPHGTHSLAGKCAVVTGAGSGLGRDCALALGLAGARLVLVGRSGNALLETQQQLAAIGAQSEVRCCDVTDDHAIEQLFASLSGCDVVVNNAGTNVPEPFLDVRAETLNAILNLNVRSVFRVSQCAARRMVAQRSGAIVNMSSQMGHVGAEKRTAYCMSKHAVEGLTKALAIEMAPFGVRVNAVAPTYVDTPLTRPFLEDREFRDRVLRDIPLGRLATTNEVADAVVFLASPAASMITGTSLPVDGGYIAR